MKPYMKQIVIIMILWISCSAEAMLPVIDPAALIQLSDQLIQLKNETVLIQEELSQLHSGQYEWSNAQGLINNLGAVVNQTNALAYSGSNINQTFQQDYPGYQPPSNFSQQYQNNANMTLTTLNGILQSVGTSSVDFQDENTRLQFLQQQSQSATGQVQAIQAATQIASEMVTQQQLLRQVVVAQTNAQDVYYATQTQNDASSKAELQTIVQAGSTSIPNYGSSGHQLVIPNF